MAAGTFEKTSWDWQLQQIFQQVGEWFEALLPSRPAANSPSPTLPEWLLRGLFWLLVFAVLAWTSWQLYQLLLPYLKRWQLEKPERLVIATPTPPKITDWLQQARTAQQQGDYREACRALYMATLQQLSQRGLIPAAESRTDGEYLNLLQLQNLPAPYRVLIQTHERLWFDRVTPSAETYQRCWQAYQEIEGR